MGGGLGIDAPRYGGCWGVLGGYCVRGGRSGGGVWKGGLGGKNVFFCCVQTPF